VRGKEEEKRKKRGNKYFKGGALGGIRKREKKGTAWGLIMGKSKKRKKEEKELSVDRRVAYQGNHSKIIGGETEMVGKGAN